MTKETLIHNTTDKDGRYVTTIQRDTDDQSVTFNHIAGHVNIEEAESTGFSITADGSIHGNQQLGKKKSIQVWLKILNWQPS